MLSEVEFESDSVGTLRGGAEMSFAEVSSTPVHARRSVLRLVRWLVIVAAFAVFAFSLLAGTSFGATSFQQAARLVTPRGGEGALVVVPAGLSGWGGWVRRQLGLKTSWDVCWLSRQELAQVESRLGTGRTDIQGHPVLTVPGASASGLRRAFGGSLNCVSMGVRELFFLPVDGSLS